MEIEESQKKVDSYISSFEEGYFPPLVQLAALTEEIGELAREINHLEGKKTKRDNNELLEDELGDVLFALICISNSYNISLEKALKKTMDKYKKRDKDRWHKKRTL